MSRMKFLRMKPGHGEVLIAEGDPEVCDEERELIEAFREQLDAACGPRARQTAGRREAADGPAFAEVRGRRPRHLLPRAAGGRSDPRHTSHAPRPQRHRDRHRVLLWRAALGSRSPARRRVPRRARAAGYDPGASAAPSSAPAPAEVVRQRGGVGMYRDLGFIRVWGKGGARASSTPTSSTRTSRSSPTCRRPASCSTSTASSSPTRPARTAAPGCPTPTTCSPSGWP
jgi:hypothetical protein